MKYPTASSLQSDDQKVQIQNDKSMNSLCELSKSSILNHDLDLSLTR